MTKDELSTAQRSPRGQPYSGDKKTGGVDYKNPVAPQPPLDENEQVLSILNEKGQEVPDPVPMEPPLGYSTAPSLAEFVQRMIHGEISRRAAMEEFETFEESDDFDIEDDPLDPLTPYEEIFMPKPPPPVAPSAAAPVEGGAGGGGPSPPPGPPPPEPPSNEKPSAN